MVSENRPLHIFLFPFMAHGHGIPTLDMAKLFASKGVNCTIITTPLNASFFSKALGKSKTHCTHNIHIQVIKFPCLEVGLPQGCETINSVPSVDLVPTFFKATRLLQEPLEQLLLEQQPDCVIADMFFPWATDSASKFGIPRLVFHGVSFISLCANQCVSQYKPHQSVSSDSEPFVITNLPGEIKLTRMQLHEAFTNDAEISFNAFFKEIFDSEARSYGVVVNSFYELENVYADYYTKVIERKAWHIGPLSLCNRDTEEKAYRGKEASIDKNECLKWLDTKKPNSVVYISFGSLAKVPDSQLRDIAMGLEASGQQFIWVVRKDGEEEEGEKEEWLPEGFEKRMEGKGLIIRGWAPQVLILEHEAIGAFVTHCGWNSTLEGVSAGVPMVTWPIGAEQFYNEKLITDVLKIGVPVGSKKWDKVFARDSVKWEALEKALKRIMAGEEAEEMRNRAKVLAQKALQAVEAGGSSDISLDVLIHELSSLRGHASV